MHLIRPYLPIWNALMVSLVALVLCGGSFLHDVIPHHDDDGKAHDTWTCPVCKITESNPGHLASDLVFGTLSDTRYPAPRALPRPLGPNCISFVDSRAPPTSA